MTGQGSTCFFRTSPSWGSVLALGTGRGDRCPQAGASRLWKRVQTAWSTTPPPGSCIPPHPSPSFVSWSEAPDLDKCHTVERDLAFHVAPEGTNGRAWWGELPRGKTRPRERETGGTRQRTLTFSVVCSRCSFSCKLFGVDWGGVVHVIWSSSWDGQLQHILWWWPSSHPCPPCPRVPLHSFWFLPLRCITLASGSAFWGPGLTQEMGLQEVAGLTMERLARAVVTALSLPPSGSKGVREGVDLSFGNPTVLFWAPG